MITLKKNKPIQLNIPSFTCDDNAVGSHLNDHPLTKLLNVYGFLCVKGRPGSGKTSLTISLISQNNPKIYKKTHHHIIVLMPQNSINSLKKNPFKDIDQDNIYNELTEDNILNIYNKIDDYSSKNEKTLLYIDDMTADLKRSKFISDTLKRMIFNRRHLKCNIIITTQTYPNILLDIRKCITNLILFRPPKMEMLKIFEELIENKKEIFDKILNLTYDMNHNFLFVNVPSQRLFKMFDEIIINDN